jgi:hypothetical protein
LLFEAGADTLYPSMSSPALQACRNAPVVPGLCRIGGVAALVLLAYSVAMMAQLTILGGQPSSAAEAFDLLNSNRVVGLLRLDLPTVLVLPFYYPLFLALSAALWRIDGVKALLSALLALAGVTLALATPMALSMVPLSEKYAAATTEAARNQLLAAGEAILATDMWHGTGAQLGGALLQAGAVLICIAMLPSPDFSKLTGWLGIVMHSLDLAHIVLGLFLPLAGTILLAVAGPMYPIWFFLIGRGLWRIAQKDTGAWRSDTLPA